MVQESDADPEPQAAGCYREGWHRTGGGVAGSPDGERSQLDVTDSSHHQLPKSRQPVAGSALSPAGGTE